MLQLSLKQRKTNYKQKLGSLRKGQQMISNIIISSACIFIFGFIWVYSHRRIYGLFTFKEMQMSVKRMVFRFGIVFLAIMVVIITVLFPKVGAVHKFMECLIYILCLSTSLVAGLFMGWFYLKLKIINQKKISVLAKI